VKDREEEHHPKKRRTATATAKEEEERLCFKAGRASFVSSCLKGVLKQA